MALTLKQFADDAGVTIEPCGPGWGGRWGYTSKDYPESTICGFKTKREARRSWAKDTFGEYAAKALFKLLGETP